MRISKIICDGCGKEIVGKPIRLYAKLEERDVKEELKQKIQKEIEKGTGQKEILWEPEKDFCEECMNKIKNFVEHVGKEPEKIKEEKKAKNFKPIQELGGKKPSIRELILQGKSRDEVLKIAECTPQSFSQAKYKLKKEGLLKEEEKAHGTVKCSEHWKDCAYASKTERNKTCYYLLMTGNRRGCDTEKCTVYRKK